MTDPRSESSGAPPRFPVLALVTSAGGLHALTTLLAPMPPDLPAAVLVGQHLDPEQPDRLAAILAERTRLPVRTTADGDRLTPATVLVAPTGSHVLVGPDDVTLIETGSLPPNRPSADLLLATLAVSCGPRVLAVVLTGKGHDAQAGIRAVHRYGGTVLAQDEASADYFGMPDAAISTGLVHAVHPLHDLPAAILTRLATATT